MLVKYLLDATVFFRESICHKNVHFRMMTSWNGIPLQTPQTVLSSPWARVLGSWRSISVLCVAYDLMDVPTLKIVLPFRSVVSCQEILLILQRDTLCWIKIRFPPWDFLVSCAQSTWFFSDLVGSWSARQQLSLVLVSGNPAGRIFPLGVPRRQRTVGDGRVLELKCIAQVNH